MLPEEVSIITEEQRDWDDMYQVDSGRTYCFEFLIEPGTAQVFKMVHTRVQAQDLSLRCWFSEKPFGKQEFPFEDHMDSFPIPRHMREIIVGAPSTQEKYTMPANKILYLMVQNMQNSENFFKLVFETKA